MSKVTAADYSGAPVDFRTELDGSGNNIPANVLTDGSGNVISPATSVKQESIITLLTSILSEQQNDVILQAYIWEDPTGPVFYREERVRPQDGSGTVSTVYTRLSDNVVVTSMPAGVQPVGANTDRDVQHLRWRATANGTGYSTGDWLTQTMIIDTAASGSVIASFWYNATTGLGISAPSSADIEDTATTLLSSINSKVATSAKQDTGNNSLASIDNKLPTKGSAPAANSTPVVIADDQVAIPVIENGIGGGNNWLRKDVAESTISGETTVTKVIGRSPASNKGWYNSVTVTHPAGSSNIQLSAAITGRADGLQIGLSFWFRTSSSFTFRTYISASDGTASDTAFQDFVTVGDGVWRRYCIPLTMTLPRTTTITVQLYIGADAVGTYNFDIDGVMVGPMQNGLAGPYSPPAYASSASGANIVRLPNHAGMSVAWVGDSYVNGAGGFNPRDVLQQALGIPAPYNGGIGSETSSQILGRFGGITWAGSTSYSTRTANGDYVLNGSNIYTCSQSGVSAASGGPTGTGSNITDGTCKWNYVATLASQQKYLRAGLVILCMGRNDISSPSTVIANIDAFVSILPIGTRFLIEEVANNTAEPVGSANHIAMTAINNYLHSKYGQRISRWRPRVCAGTAGDIPAAGLMYDSTHLNAQGQALRVEEVIRSADRCGFLPSGIISSGDIQDAQPYGWWIDTTAGILNGTLNATTAAYALRGCTAVTAILGQITSGTPATYQLQVCGHDLNWTNVGSTFTASTSAYATATVTGVVAEFVRIICTVGGVSQAGMVNATITGRVA